MAGSEAEVFAAGGSLLINCVGLVIGLAISALICYLLYTDLQRIPPQHRKQEPNMVWLLMIPLFNLVWNFFVWPKIAESYQSYFDAQGVTGEGDYGRQLSMILCIAAALCLIPLLNCLAGPVALVLYVLLLVKFNGYKNRIQPSA